MAEYLCKEDMNTGEYMTDWQNYKYCPYCGARMDGDTNG